MSVLLATCGFVGLALLAPSPSSPAVTRVNPRDGLTYAFVPAGSFRMGTDRADAPPNERPAHEVRITRGFWMCTTEVTVGAYRRFARETGRAMPPDTAEGIAVDPGWADERLPIVNVTWDDAEAYCRWAGGDLPTEAQWEYAARGGVERDPYAELDSIAWTAANSGRARLDADSLFAADKAHYEQVVLANAARPHPVALKQPNAYGLYDMIGNVGEWTRDRADLGYYAKSPATDPEGPPTGVARVLRGGHYLYPPTLERASKRLWNEPGGRSPIAGFRSMLAGTR